MTKKLNDINIESIREMYKPDTNLFTKDNSKIACLKMVIDQDLNAIERNIIIYYAECGSQRKLAKALGISSSKVNTMIKQIRNKIISKYNEYNFI